MSSLRPNPLDLPEVLTRIGQFIPLWVRNSNSSYGLIFEPQDLLSAMAVSRHFYVTLTPLLWTVYDDTILQSEESFGLIEQGLYNIPFNLILSKSHYFQFFVNRLRPPPSLLSPPHSPLPHATDNTNTRFNSRHLQELSISHFFPTEQAIELVLANPRLLLLDWKSPSTIGFTATPAIYQALLSLRHLRTLHLSGWNQIPEEEDTDPLHRLRTILVNNSAHLQNLSLSFMSGLESITEWVVLPNLRTLALNNVWESNPALVHLVRFCPALETLTIHADGGCDVKTLAPLLRDHCPKLSAIRRSSGHITFQRGFLLLDEDYVTLIEECRPLSTRVFTTTEIEAERGSQGLLTEHGAEHHVSGLKHFEMGFGGLNMTITNALLTHANHLETLILFICGDETENFENANRLLSICTHLKRFEFYNYHLEWNPEDGMLLFQTPWACRGIEMLILDGFADPFENHAFYQEWDDDGGSDDDLGGVIIHTRRGGEVHGDVRLEQLNDPSAGPDSGLGQDYAAAATTAATVETTTDIDMDQGCILFKIERNDDIPAIWQITDENIYNRTDHLQGTYGRAFKRMLFSFAETMPNLVTIELNGRVRERVKV
ncbi:hypothetical protein BGZ80_007585 [Entomortierella chlamydospora]|uniref:F-box domain-containing protein n=1 Tax=Entomortierella chlamydospora TaxID=101097 RepID=A0A9P6MY00_9FUNG|nr:hypothetical protein BGZ79_009051 [Entomortierella chlamydospora]KAG0018073.1 hypothetical protein BGZ80_007585 [Entomortierella chlamydospora]